MVGEFLYYAGAVEPTMLAALRKLAAAQSKGTEETKKLWAIYLITAPQTHIPN